MYALIQNNEIVKVFANPEGFTLNGNQYSSQIFTLWSNEEKNAIGIYEIETDSSNFKDESYYINTNEIFAFSNGKATRSWGNAFAKQLEDVNAVDQNGAPILQDGKQVVTKGLKSNFIAQVKDTAGKLLNATDWYVIRKAERNVEVPAEVALKRTQIVAEADRLEVDIQASTTVEALIEVLNAQDWNK